VIRVALLLAALASGLVVTGCSSTSTAAPTLSDVSTLLARHGQAVLRHDRSAFVADLDRSSAAAAFRARQEDAYDNLVDVPLTSWSYRVESRTDDRAAETAASKKYGGPALVVRISLSYALRGIDRVPTSHELWWTFVRSGGRVVIAADDALAQAGGISWKGPWDFGPLEVLRGPHSLVLGHADSTGVLPSVEAAVESAVPAVSAVWGNDWSRAVAVVVPSSADELTAQVGLSSPVTTAIAAVAVSDGQDPLTGAVYGQRLVVNPAALTRLSAIGRQIIVRHEITHIASAAATTGASPRWLVEGFADYVGNLHSGQPVTAAASELRADVRRGAVPVTLPSEASFDTDGQAAQAYEGAWLACRLIAQRAGQQQLVRFYRLVGASSDAPDAAVAAALRTVLHESTARFTAQWRTYLKAQLA
jgi:outer membrane murein-binding lipoprotein Lpp